MKTQKSLIEIGNSLGFIIPKEVVKELKLKANDLVEADIIKYPQIKKWACKCGQIFDASHDELEKWGCPYCLEEDVNNFDELYNESEVEEIKDA